MNTKYRITWFVSALALPLMQASAQEQIQTTPEEWVCKYCPFEEGIDAGMALGVGYVSDEGYKFGGYLGLEDDGFYPYLDADLRYRADGARYVDFDANAIGMPFSSVNLEAGQQGRYRIGADYRQIPRLFTDGGMTPYRGVGSGHLILPADWVHGPTTGMMPTLSESLVPIAIEQERQQIGLRFSWVPAARWETFAAFRRDEVEGLRKTAGTFLTNAAILPEPVDHTTEQVDLGLAYYGDRFQGQVAYYGSFFSNGQQSLVWDNPYTPMMGEDTGRMALAPDNAFQQVSLSGVYRIAERTHLMGNLARGRGTQDETFLPYTINEAVAAGELPRNSLDGKINTTNTSVRLTTTPWDPLRITAEYRFSERDNETPQETWTYVVTDTTLGIPRTNLPYSFEEQQTRIRADYRVSPSVRLAAAVERKEQERTLQEVEETEEDTLWAELRVRYGQSANLKLRGGRAEREGSAVEVVDEIIPPQNPLLRKFNLADRERDFGEFRFDYRAANAVTFGVSASYASNDYINSAVGLTASEDISATVDASWAVNPATSFYAFYTWQRLESEQTGSEDFGAPDWFATHEDRIDSLGVGVTARLGEATQAGIDYVYTKSTGRIAIDRPGTFPDLEAKLHSLRLFARHSFTEQLGVRVGIHYERFSSTDWSIDNVEPDTIPNLLALGEESPEYDAYLATVAVSYRF